MSGKTNDFYLQFGLPGMVNSGSESSSNTSFEVSGGLSSKMSSPSLSENIMRKVERDPYEVYQHAKVLGTGSMVSIMVLHDVLFLVAIWIIHILTCMRNVSNTN